MKETPLPRHSLSRSSSVNGIHGGDVRTSSRTQSSHEDYDDADCGIRIKRLTSRASSERVRGDAHSAYKRNTSNRISNISTTSAQYIYHHENPVTDASQAQFRLSAASNYDTSMWDSGMEAHSDQAPQGPKKSPNKRKRGFLKTAIRSLLGQKSDSELQSDKQLTGANSSHQGNGTADVGVPDMAMAPSASLRRSVSTPVLRHVSRPVLESYSPLDSLDSVLHSKIVKPVPSTPALRSTPLESVLEAPSESTSKVSTPLRRSASQAERPSTLISQRRQIGLAVGGDDKLKRQSRSVDGLLQINGGDSGNSGQRRNTETEHWEQSSGDMGALASSAAAEQAAFQQLMRDTGFRGKGHTHYHVPIEEDNSVYHAQTSNAKSSFVNNDATELGELVDRFQAPEDTFRTAGHDRNKSAASRTSDLDRQAGKMARQPLVRSPASSQQESFPTADQFLTLLNLINHERAARKTLQSRLEELKIEVAELRSRTLPTHPLRMHPLHTIPQAPPSPPPPTSPDLRLSASFSGLIKHRLERATRFTPPRPPSPMSVSTTQLGRDSGQTDVSSGVNTEDEEALMAHKVSEDFREEQALQHVVPSRVPYTHAISSTATGSGRPNGFEHIIQPAASDEHTLVYLPTTTYVPHR